MSQIVREYQILTSWMQKEWPGFAGKKLKNNMEFHVIEKTEITDIKVP